MAGKYQALSQHLLSLGCDRWTASFAEIEAILGFPLPNSARQHNAWWANQHGQGYKQCSSWMEADWHSADLDLALQTVTFVRLSSPKSASGGHLRLAGVSIAKANKFRGVEDNPVKHDWDTSPAMSTSVEFQWQHAGAVRLLGGRLVFPSEISALPGLYRFRIRNKAGAESRYVGETDNLSRRMGNYRNPGPTQATNIRMAEILVAALAAGAEVALSIATDTTFVVRDGQRAPADLAMKCVRRMFENFVQYAEWDEEIESLNR